MKNTAIIVTGSRSFNDYSTFKTSMDTAIELKLNGNKNVTIIHGNMSGTDALAKRYASENKMKTKMIKADWKNGNRTEYIRNGIMRKEALKVDNAICVCFWDGHNQKDANYQNAVIAQKKGIDVVIFELDSCTE